MTPVTDRLTLPTISSVSRSPQLIYDYAGLERRIERSAAAARERNIILAYSIKTNPDPHVLRRMEARGLCAEAINGAVVQAAVSAGFTHDRIVLGGVGKVWPTGHVPGGLLALLDDSTDTFMESARASAGHRLHCIRLRFPRVSSRLGVDTSSVHERERVAAALLEAREAGVAVGLATHQRSSHHSGADEWLTSVQGLLEDMDDAAPGLSRFVDALDLGGGFTAAGLDDLLLGQAGRRLLRFVEERLPSCQVLILEPGRSLVQAHGFVVSSVIAKVSVEEVIVDASLAELPWPVPDSRPVYFYRQGEWCPLGPGAGILAGRTTMETDILASVADVSDLHVGDMICFAEAGAYDVSMRNQFGAGNVLGQERE